MISFEIEITVKYFYFSDVYFITEKKKFIYSFKTTKIYCLCFNIVAKEKFLQYSWVSFKLQVIKNIFKNGTNYILSCSINKKIVAWF